MWVSLCYQLINNRNAAASLWTVPTHHQTAHIYFLLVCRHPVKLSVTCQCCRIKKCTHFFAHLQVDNNQGLLLRKEKEEALSLPAESLLKRQTATTYLRGQYEASVRQKKANRASQNGTEQAEEVKGANLSSQTSFQTKSHHHQPYTQTHLLPQPYSNPQSSHSKSSTLPLSASTDHPKVCYFNQNAASVQGVYVCLLSSNVDEWSGMIHIYSNDQNNQFDRRGHFVPRTKCFLKI